MAGEARLSAAASAMGGGASVGATGGASGGGRTSRPPSKPQRRQRGITEPNTRNCAQQRTVSEARSRMAVDAGAHEVANGVRMGDHAVVVRARTSVVVADAEQTTKLFIVGSAKGNGMYGNGRDQSVETCLIGAPRGGR